MSKKNIFLNGLIKENPTFVLFLGMCPILAVSSSMYSALGMAVCVFIVLLLSNLIISLIAKIVPNEIRIPVYIIVIATIVTIVDMFTQAFASGIHSVLGSYLQLIVVNCIILGRAEAFASKNSVVDSLLDAIGMSCGFLLAILVVSFVRELLGTGAITLYDLKGDFVYSLKIIPEEYTISLLVQPTGAFLVLGVAVAIFNQILYAHEQKVKKLEEAKKKALSEGAE